MNTQNEQAVQDEQTPLTPQQDDYNESKPDSEDTTGKIFIGGLSWQTTDSTLRYYFEKFGELTDVALMMDKRTGKPRGFGFIRMKDPAAADVVMANEHTIDGRLVDVKRALPRDKAPGPARCESCKVFVGGLSAEVTEKEFGDYFCKYGPVKDAVVMVDRNTGSSRGFGFITFEKEDAVAKVLSIEHEIKGKYVEIKRAEPREVARPMGYGDYGGRGGGGGRGNMNSRYPSNGPSGPRDYGYGNGGGYQQQGPGQQQGYGGRGGNNNNMGYRAYPNAATAGYSAAAMAYRGGAPYAMGAMPGYGYPTNAAMGGAPTMGYYNGAMAGGAGQYPAYNAGTDSPQSQPAYREENDYSDSPPPSKGGYDSSAIAAGYATAAMQMQQRAGQPQQAAAYGAAYGAPAYGYMVQGQPQAAPVQQQGGRPQGDASGGYPEGYGAYRGQAAAQGRADRSYRPY